MRTGVGVDSVASGAGVGEGVRVPVTGGGVRYGSEQCSGAGVGDVACGLWARSAGVAKEDGGDDVISASARMACVASCTVTTGVALPADRHAAAATRMDATITK